MRLDSLDNPISPALVHLVNAPSSLHHCDLLSVGKVHSLVVPIRFTRCLEYRPSTPRCRLSSLIRSDVRHFEKSKGELCQLSAVARHSQTTPPLLGTHPDQYVGRTQSSCEECRHVGGHAARCSRRSHPGTREVQRGEGTFVFVLLPAS